MSKEVVTQLLSKQRSLGIEIKMSREKMKDPETLKKLASIFRLDKSLTKDEIDELCSLFVKNVTPLDEATKECYED